MPPQSNENPPPESGGTTRRDFLKTSAAFSVAAAMAPGAVFARGSDTIRVGLIGCGGRGTGAAGNCVESSPGVKIVALADLYKDRLERCRKNLQDNIGDGFDVTNERTFVGFDAYEQLLSLDDLDMVILATPPAFRPSHLEAAVAAGKHVFMEKPVAVDPAGIRSVLASSAVAAERGLAIVSGTQRRHQAPYIEYMRRIHDGAIGDLVGGQCYWNQGGLWVVDRKPEYSDMEWQTRNWLYFTWLSGDHIVEQHIHNIDVMNWAMRSTPEKAMGLGGRQSRTDAKYGNIFDHFAIEFTYPGDVRVLSMCRQMEGTPSNVSEHVVGSKGTFDSRRGIEGENAFRFREKSRNPYVQEHADLIASIRANQPLNEGKRVAESTLTAIMGRMACYTGQVVTWEHAMASELDLVPKTLSFGSLSMDPVAVPGRTPLI